MSNPPPADRPPPPTSAAASRAPRRSTRHRSVRRWLPYLLGSILVAVLLAGFRPQPVPVETGRVNRGELRATIREEGRTRIRQRYIISAPVTGQLRRIDLRAGAEVRADQTLLATIDPISPILLDARSRSLATARRDAAAALVDKARTAHEFAMTDLRRFEQLYRDRTISQQELESYQWREVAAAKELAAAESALREAEAELAQFDSAAQGNPSAISVNLASADIRSPVDGRVLRVFEENARVVTAGTPLLEVGDPTDLEVVIDVLSRDGATLHPGTPVELDQWGGGPPLQARVRLVEPAAFTKISALGVEEQRVNVIADLLTPPDKRPGLGDGFRVEADIVVWQNAEVLKAPAGALFRQGADWAAFVIEGERAVLHRVRAGRSSGRETQILDGLDEDAEVILYPGNRVRDGQRVRPVQVSSATSPPA